MNAYKQKMDELIQIAKSHPGTGGQRALISLLGDMDGNGPIAELLHTLDSNNFQKVISLFVEFRTSGRRENFNDLHFKAKNVMRELSSYGRE